MTHSRVWIDERPRYLGRAAASLFVVGCAVVVIGTVLWRDRMPGASTQRTADVVPATETSAARPASQTTPAVPRLREEPSQAALTHCPYQRLNLAFADGKSAVATCVGATRVVLNGDTRSHLVEPDGTSVWRLQVDVAGGDVMSVNASAPSRSAYRCEQAACSGVSLTPRDAQGRRRLMLKDTILATAVTESQGASSPLQAASSLRLTATLALPADQEDSRLACPDGTRIDVVERQGANFALCPLEFSAGGAGDGRRAFAFVGSEGDQLTVDMGADGTIDRVQLGALRCLRDACSGVVTQAGAEAGKETGRSFTFFGLTLTDGRSGGASATLTGRVVVPPL